MVNPMHRLDNIPRAARATPRRPQILRDTKIVTARAATGTMVDKYPRARPKMILVAEPEVQD